jgi:hypothetical protein
MIFQVEEEVDTLPDKDSDHTLRMIEKSLSKMVPNNLVVHVWLFQVVYDPVPHLSL